VKEGEKKSLLGPFQRRGQIIGVSVEVIQLTDKVTGPRYSFGRPRTVIKNVISLCIFRKLHVAQMGYVEAGPCVPAGGIFAFLQK